MSEMNDCTLLRCAAVLATVMALLLAMPAAAEPVMINPGSVDLAQTHVLNADSPVGPNQGEQPWLIGDRDALFKVNFIASQPGVAISRLEAWLTLFSAQGLSLSIPLAAPSAATTFATEFDIHPAKVVHSFEDSHTATIPAQWMKPGLTWQLNWVVYGELGEIASTQLLTSGYLDVGPPHVMKLNLIDVQWFVPQTPFKDFPADLFDEMEQKLPVSRLDVRRAKQNLFPAVAMPASGSRPPVLVRSLQEWNDVVGDGEVTRSSRWASVLQKAAGNNYYEVANFCVINHGSVASGGVGADGYFCSSQDHKGIFWHEFGHSLMLRHWGVNKDYPYKDPDAYGDGAGEVNGPIPYDTYLGLSTGTRYHNTHVGPFWAFDARNDGTTAGTFIPPWVDTDGDGTPDRWKASPMQGGGLADSEPGFHLAHYSDYSINKIGTILDRKAAYVDADNEWIDDADWAAHGAGWYFTDYTGFNPYTPDGLGRPIGRDLDVYSILVAGSMAPHDGSGSYPPEMVGPFSLIYPPIGPYESNVRTLFDPRDAGDRLAMGAANYCPTGGCDLSLAIRQAGAGFGDQVYALAVDWDESKPVSDASSFFEKALNVPAGQGAVLFVDLLLTPDAGAAGLPANPTVLASYVAPNSVPPVLSLDPDVTTIVVGLGSDYVEPSASCTDDLDYDPKIEITGEVDTFVPGTYTRTFTCTDSSGNQDVRVVSIEVPVPDGSPVGQLGILDLEANGGINPATGAPWQFGDRYRLAFVSSQGMDALAGDIAAYNQFVNDLAAAAGLTVDWRAIGSTELVAARDNTATNPTVDGTGFSIFAMDGRTRIADDYSDLWDGAVDAHITVTENGYLRFGPVFTGSGSGGMQSPDGRVLGGSSESPPKVTIADTTKELHRWMIQFNASNTDSLPVYALSEVLRVTVGQEDEPTSSPVPQGDSDFDGILDADEPMCAYDPDPLCSLREQQHRSILELIEQSVGVLTDAQISDADDDAKYQFVTDNPLRIYDCAGWADQMKTRFGVASLPLGDICSDYDGDGIPDAADEFPTIYSWSCGYSDTTGYDIDDDQCEANYSRIRQIYLSIYGRDNDPDLLSSMWQHYLEFASGQATCVGVLEQEVTDAGVSIEPHYLACASDQSRRSAEIVSMVCDDADSNTIYSPERCHLGKALYQLVSPSSFAVEANAPWYTYLGFGEVEFVAKNDFTCYTDSKFADPSLGPEMSPTSSSLCFDGNNPYEDTIFVGSQPLYGRTETLLEQIQSSHEHTYVQWDYTYREYNTYFGRLESSTEDRSKPVLVDNNFDFGTPTNTEIAMQMDEQSCWRDGKNIKEFSTQSCEEHDFAVTDKTPSDDPQFTNNSITPVAEFYSQPTGFSDGGFMLNRCRVKTEHDSWLNYIETGLDKPNLVNHAYEYSCSIDNDRLDSLITSSLIAEEAERIGMYQALAEVGMMAISNVVGLAAASKFATAGTKLAKAVNFATKTWDAIETSLEISSIAAQIYVLAAETIPMCRQMKGADKEACFATTLGGTLISLASAAGEDQLYNRSAKFMEDMSRKVSDDGQELTGDTLAAQQYREKDFRAQIEATRALVKAENGAPDIHHQRWNDVGIDLPGLLGALKSEGESGLSSDLNTAFYNLPPQVAELSIFKRTALEIFNDAEGLGTVEKSTKLLKMANGLSAIAGDLSDSDLRALESMRPANFELFVELVSNPGGVTWTNKTPRQYLDSFKETPDTGGVCYLG